MTKTAEVNAKSIWNIEEKEKGLNIRFFSREGGRNCVKRKKGGEKRKDKKIEGKKAKAYGKHYVEKVVHWPDATPRFPFVAICCEKEKTMSI